VHQWLHILHCHLYIDADIYTDVTHLITIVDE
jgi:hypothetical protein